jgi:hypothetical protein
VALTNFCSLEVGGSFYNTAVRKAKFHLTVNFGPIVASRGTEELIVPDTPPFPVGVDWRKKFSWRREEVENMGWPQLVCTAAFMGPLEYRDRFVRFGMGINTFAGCLDECVGGEYDFTPIMERVLPVLEEQGFLKLCCWGEAIEDRSYALSDPAGEDGVVLLCGFVPKVVAELIVQFTDWRYGQVCLAAGDVKLVKLLENAVVFPRKVTPHNLTALRARIQTYRWYQRPKYPSHFASHPEFSARDCAIRKEVEQLDSTQLICMAVYLGPLENEWNRVHGTSAQWVFERINGWSAGFMTYCSVHLSMVQLLVEGFLKQAWECQNFVLSQPLRDGDLDEFEGCFSPRLPLEVMRQISEFTNWHRRDLTLPYSKREVMELLLNAAVKV